MSFCEMYSMAHRKTISTQERKNLQTLQNLNERTTTFHVLMQDIINVSDSNQSVVGR